MVRKPIFIFILLLMQLTNGFSQTILGGDFDFAKPRINGTDLNQMNFCIRENLPNSLRLINFPLEYELFPDWSMIRRNIPFEFDTINEHSQGYFYLGPFWYYVDADNPKESDLFKDVTCFEQVPYFPKAMAIFIHDDSSNNSAANEYPRLYSSLKLNLNYSSALTVGKRYLITLYNLASDKTYGTTPSQYVDSLFIGSALDSMSVGDTIAITHPQLCSWKKEFIAFTPTKPYTHFTIGNCSNENYLYAANMVDECTLLSIVQTSAKTIHICPSDSVWIPFSQNYKAEWQNGDTIGAQFLTTAGWHIRYSYPTTQTVIIDSFWVKFANTTSNIINTFDCHNNLIVLNSTLIQPQVRYDWSTGQNEPTISTFESGWIICKAFNQLGCTVTDSFNITRFLPIITSLKDTTVCFEEVAKILLDAGSFKNYLWQPTGQTTQTIYSTAAQVYLLTVTDSNNCSASQQVAVMETCPEFVFIPNAFTPNADGLNDVFLPHTRNLETFNMQIVNQWGQLIFTTTDNSQGWDGKDAPIGTYVVLITYKATNKPQQSVTGNVTLLR